MERARPHPVWTGLLIAAMVFAIYGNVFIYDLMRLESGKTDQPSVLTAGPAEMILNQFWNDKNWTKFHERKYPENGTRKPPFNSTVGTAAPTPHRAYEHPTFREPDLPKVIPQE